MKALLAEEIADIINGNLPRGSYGAIADNIITDSRNARSNSLFFALQGEYTNGRNFLEDAYNRGATIAVVSELDTNVRIAQIIVPDTFVALQVLAKNYIRQFEMPIVAVTGSSGKTTTKELLWTLLSRKYKTAKSPGNLNSQTGAPLSIFGLEPDDAVCVLELSMSHPGEILANVEIIRPQTVIITNIGVAHIEFLGSRENIFKAKMESTAYLGEEGCLIVNSDDDMLSSLQPGPYSLVKCGIGTGDFSAYDILYSVNGSDFTVNIADKPEKFHFPYAGKQFVIDCLLAIACAARMGVSADEIRNGLNNFSTADSRMEITEINGIKLINDTYNANPDSMKASLGTLNAIAGKGQAVAVLGDMFELGDAKWELTKQVGEYAAGLNLQLLILSGETSEAFSSGYIGAKGSGEIFISNDYEEIANKLGSWLKPGDSALFKASRGMRFEEILLMCASKLNEDSNKKI